ncbi:glucose-methanol-choline oxidoreductase-like protein [Pyrenochaeta sp. DS3sAY3a]|nr:glucose-methanol-choline oxidoreductase-like protein [Pyrenochaeta sp. DS3sAY3a]
MESQFDYIVVGGGTAGVVIASRLKQYLPESRIALVEAGPNAVNHPKITDITDAGNWVALLQDGLTVDYSTTPQEHLDNRQIMNPAGRLLSGSSGVNVGTWMRASTADLAVLAEKAGHERFTYKNMLKYFNRVETHFDTGADPEFNGFDGPIHTVGGRNYPLREIIKQSVEKMGHSYNPEPTKGNPIALTDFVQNFRATSESTATRQHSGKVYNLTGVDVFCDSPVARILFNSSKEATGVELISGTQFTATKEVIVCCGTQKTPQTLMLSGIGPAATLEKHGITTLVDAPAVGQNLFDHSAYIQYFKLKDASTGLAAPFSGTHRPEFGHGLPVDFALFANIPADELAPHLAADGIDTSQENGYFDPGEQKCHYMTIPFYGPTFAHPLLYPSLKLDGSIIALTALHMLPLSRGSVNLASTDPTAHPICNPRLLSTATDRFILRHAVRSNLSLAATEPLASLLAGEVAPAVPGLDALSASSTDAQIDARLRALSVTISHPMGTCALGTVLDAGFRVKGVKGLRVCDASVFAEPVAVMPSWTVYALAEMCAEIVAGREGVVG